MAEITERKILKTYYARMKNCSVSVPVLDDKGEQIPVRDPNGNEKRGYAGAKVFVMETLKFSTVSANPKIGYLATYMVLSDNPQAKYHIKKLDECVKNPASPVMDEKMYKQSKNKEAYEMEEKLAKANEEKAALEQLVTQREEAMEKMAKTISELEAKGKNR